MSDRWKTHRFTVKTSYIIAACCSVTHSSLIREFFEEFNLQCMTGLAPDDYLSLDETLYAMRNQISFKQYNI